MRMTRAALRAQAQAEEQEQEYEQPEQQETYTEKEYETPRRIQARSSAQIHEDPAEIEAENKPETDDPSVRLALRDITGENYSQADGTPDFQICSPTKSQPYLRRQEYLHEEEEQSEHSKSTRKVGGKAKSRTKKQLDGPIVVEVETQTKTIHTQEQAEDLSPVAQLDESLATQQASEEGSPVIQEGIEVAEAEAEPEPAIEEEHNPLSISRTPRFDPALHVPADEAVATEDSFVQSITSRSPARFVQTQAEHPQPSEPPTSIVQAHTPLRRESSTNFEESFEAMDSLEDTIEQLTADLPTLPTEAIYSSESPVKSVPSPIKPENAAVTTKISASRTPRSAINKLQTISRSQDKENTPPLTKTPLSKLSRQQSPSKSKTPTTKPSSPLKPRTPAVKQVSPNKGVTASTHKTSFATNTKPESTRATAINAQPAKTRRRTVVTAEKNSESMMSKSVSVPQLKPSQKQPLATTTNTRSEILPRKSVVPTQQLRKSHQSSMSFSNSPTKQQPTHQRRITSGGVLSTSKPGFIPAKSSKPPTASSFALPGEAVAEKLKAQKEAREEKMRQPKLTLAEQKAAKLKADREAREERVRLNQVKSKEAEAEKEKPKVARPPSMAVLTVSKARAEAAERGRQASKEWAEKMLKKKQPAVVQGPEEPQAVTAS